MRNYRDAKCLAKSLRQAILDKKNIYLGRSESLEIVSKMFGFRDWNTLSARINNSNTNECELRPKALISLKVDSSKAHCEIPLVFYKKITGFYKHESGILAKIFFKNNTLIFEVGGQLPIEFIAKSDRSFFSRHNGMHIAFHHDQKGNVFCRILQQDGRETQWPQISINEAVIIESSLKSRIIKNEPAPNSERFLRRLVLGIITGSPYYNEMSSDHAKATYQQICHLQEYVSNAGKLQYIKFIGVQDDGSDIYHAQHEHRLLRWSIYLDSTSSKILFSKLTSGG